MTKRVYSYTLQTEMCMHTNRGMNVPVTIKEIAELANVSRGTVDRALHGRGGVRPDVEKRICMIAENMGYRPNSAARALSKLRNNLVIGLLLPSIDNPFFDDLIEGARSAQKEFSDHGVKLIEEQMQGYNVSEQISRIDALVKKGIDALAFLPFDDSQIIEKINELTAAGIDVITVNSDICGSQRSTYVGVDFEKSGRMAAGVVGLINPRAKVLIVLGSPKLLSHNLRIQGFFDVIQSRFPGVEVCAKVVCHDDHFLAYDVTRRSLYDKPEIDMIYIVGEGITGVCAAVKEFKNRQIDIVCFDDVPHTKRLIAEGRISATICQQPFQQGYNAVQQCYYHFLGINSGDSDKVLMDNIVKIWESLE